MFYCFIVNKTIKTAAARIRDGKVAVNIVNMKDDLGDTLEALEKDRAFLKELAEGCGNKESEWSERQKVRGEELLALAETIKLLNEPPRFASFIVLEILEKFENIF